MVTPQGSSLRPSLPTNVHNLVQNVSSNFEPPSFNFPPQSLLRSWLHTSHWYRCPNGRSFQKVARRARGDYVEVPQYTVYTFCWNGQSHSGTTGASNSAYHPRLGYWSNLGFNVRLTCSYFVDTISNGPLLPISDQSITGRTGSQYLKAKAQKLYLGCSKRASVYALLWELFLLYLLSSSWYFVLG